MDRVLTFKNMYPVYRGGFTHSFIANHLERESLFFNIGYQTYIFDGNSIHRSVFYAAGVFKNEMCYFYRNSWYYGNDKFICHFRPEDEAKLSNGILHLLFNYETEIGFQILDAGEIAKIRLPRYIRLIHHNHIYTDNAIHELRSIFIERDEIENAAELFLEDEKVIPLFQIVRDHTMETYRRKKR